MLLPNIVNSPKVTKAEKYKPCTFPKLKQLSIQTKLVNLIQSVCDLWQGCKCIKAKESHSKESILIAITIVSIGL